LVTNYWIWQIGLYSHAQN